MVLWWGAIAFKPLLCFLAVIFFFFFFIILTIIPNPKNFNPPFGFGPLSIPLSVLSDYDLEPHTSPILLQIIALHVPFSSRSIPIKLAAQELNHKPNAHTALHQFNLNWAKQSRVASGGQEKTLCLNRFHRLCFYSDYCQKSYRTKLKKR